MATPFAVWHQTDTRSVTVLHLVAESTPAFGDALAGNALLSAGVAFDDFGRPFTVGLDRRVDHQDRGLGLAGYVSQPDME